MPTDGLGAEKNIVVRGSDGAWMYDGAAGSYKGKTGCRHGKQPFMASAFEELSLRHHAAAQ